MLEAHQKFGTVTCKEVANASKRDKFTQVSRTSYCHRISNADLVDQGDGILSNWPPRVAPSQRLPRSSDFTCLRQQPVRHFDSKRRPQSRGAARQRV